MHLVGRMNWEAIGAVGELVGAAAVVLTLFYLARQVRESSEESRQNQEELRKSRYDALNRELSRTADEWATHSDLSGIMHRGLVDTKSLSPEEVFRLYANLHRFFRGLEALFVYSAEGGIQAWATKGWRVALTDFMTWPGVQKYWDDRGHWYSDAFRAEVSQVRSQPNAMMADAYEAASQATADARPDSGR